MTARDTGRQRDRKTEKQRDSEIERQRHRETERYTERESKSFNVSVPMLSRLVPPWVRSSLSPRLKMDSRPDPCSRSAVYLKKP